MPGVPAGVPVPGPAVALSWRLGAAGQIQPVRGENTDGRWSIVVTSCRAPGQAEGIHKVGERRVIG